MGKIKHLKDFLFGHIMAPTSSIYILYLSSPNFPAPAGNFSLTAGVNAVLSQLQLVCTQKKQFRALNLDIECPPSLPELTQCQCLTKDKDGDLISKVDGKISFDVSYHNLEI